MLSCSSKTFCPPMFRLKIALDLEWPLRQRLVTFLCAESQDVSHCRWFPERQHQVWPELSSEILALVIAAGFSGKGVQCRETDFHKTYY